ncbi:MAG: S9 family peptidase [Deltaproteobacteria bacterium]|nr:S9 family peptidase [Deltaproteobacteria bacterium]
MNRHALLLLALLGLPTYAVAQDAAPATTVDESAKATDETAKATDDDPHLWLEEVEGETQLDWARARNAEVDAVVTAVDGFEALSDRLLTLYDSSDRIPYVGKRGDFFYNHWTDSEHPRGLWRRTTPDSYATDTPDWDVLLDLDALGKEEGESWVWKGADCLPPAYDRCILSLSPGGSDASALREFDVPSRSFVDDGFNLPAAKQGITWIDQDTVLVEPDLGPDSQTDSGYPNTVRRWTRGTALADSNLLHEGEKTDVSSGAYRDHTPGFERTILYRSKTFYDRDYWILDGDTKTQITVPPEARIDVWRDRLLLLLRKDWEHGGTSYAAGTLLTTNLPKWLKGKGGVTPLFTPTDSTSLVSFEHTKSHLILNTLDTVRSEISVLTPKGKKWLTSELPGLPDLGRVTASPVDGKDSEDYFLNITGYLTPSTLAMGTIGGEKATTLKQLPSLFEAEGLEVQQHFATSDDGTKIPYFQVSKKDIVLDGSNPTLLYGYGGFLVSLRPRYSATRGITWLERGGVFVVANIRGGGEFGPAWHQAALKEKRHTAYQDFASVAKDLVARKVTTPDKLGAEGGSNGGLLVGNMYTLYPELFGGVLCSVPLLDMKRYSKLLAGASWMGEYGNPDVPEEWEYIQTFSPYHNLDASEEHPPMLISTSTKDDRVHPGHARKMSAKLMELGKNAWYYENIEGGHGGAADNAQAAYLYALKYTWLWEVLNGRSFAMPVEDTAAEELDEAAEE